jgi:hypothetical protein
MIKVRIETVRIDANDLYMLEDKVRTPPSTFHTRMGIEVRRRGL